MATRLRELLEQAESDIDTYRYPSIDDTQEALNQVLDAAGLRNTGSDRVTRLVVGREVVQFTTEYSVRCCAQSDDFELPIHIVDAEDPIRAAKVWGIEKGVREAEAEVSQVESVLAGARQRLEAARARLDELS